MRNWTDEFGRERYGQSQGDELGGDDDAYIGNGYGTRDARRARAVHDANRNPAWFSGDRGDDSWRRGEEEIARYESRYPQAQYRRQAGAPARRPWGETAAGWGRASEDSVGREGYARSGVTAGRAEDGAPGGRGYVSGYANGYADGYRAGQQAGGVPGEAPALHDDLARGRRSGPKGYMRSDDRVREAVCERLAAEHALDVSEVGVAVSSGIVTLDGSVSQRHVKYAIEDIVDDVYGVVEVNNLIRVRPYGVLASE